MKIFAIDPGNEYSAYVIYDASRHAVLEKGKIQNEQLRSLLLSSEHCTKYTCEYAIEMIASYGMAVGATVFDTCIWIGRFVEALKMHDKVAAKIYRKDVKMNLCQSMRAKDANIRQAIIDQFPRSGGGKEPAIGTKSNPGPLYGVSADMWAALGVALTYFEMKDKLGGRKW